MKPRAFLYLIGGLFMLAAGLSIVLPYVKALRAEDILHSEINIPLTRAFTLITLGAGFIVAGRLSRH